MGHDGAFTLNRTKEQEGKKNIRQAVKRPEATLKELQDYLADHDWTGNTELPTNEVEDLLKDELYILCDRI